MLLFLEASTVKYILLGNNRRRSSEAVGRDVSVVNAVRGSEQLALEYAVVEMAKPHQ